MKYCFRCREHKDLEHFTKNRRKVDGLEPYCRPCKSARYSEKRTQAADSKRLRNYGLKAQEFTDLLELQDSKCAICCVAVEVETGKYAVDHNHDTGTVRGILCKLCNTGLGNLKDSPILLRRAADYLETRGHYG